MNIAIGLIFIIISIMLLAYFAYKIYAKIKMRIKYKNAIKNNTGNFTKDEKVFIARFEEWVKAPNSKENNADKK
ncbi:hypothetical protein [Spiroplasma endosymbiont of 'Nebria riversi']|uniref:hypothetical protein n=1 Tax=Spiroplasma endosymbiont of 'Nebria riversi' TaxID=2792084 RepID=UPI001C044073|nr:hypothetical protein [Spiroplasma endosymbiont of 'Nebria riversi']